MADRITKAEYRQLAKAAREALDQAESWIHDQLDGTRGLEPALSDLDEARAVIEQAEKR